MAEHDPRRSPGADAGRSNHAGGAAFERAAGSTAEFLERGADIAKPMADLGARNMEAFVVAAKLAGRTVESLTREVTEYGRKSFEDAFAMARSFAEVRSPADLIRVQTQFARTAFDNAMAFSNNVTETLTKTAGEVAGPSAPSSSADPSGGGER